MTVLGLNCPVSVRIRHWIIPWYTTERHIFELLHMRDCEHNRKKNIKPSNPNAKYILSGISYHLQAKFIQLISLTVDTMSFYTMTIDTVDMTIQWQSIDKCHLWHTCFILSAALFGHFPFLSSLSSPFPRLYKLVFTV